jgi:hypothetical protein
METALGIVFAPQKDASKAGIAGQLVLIEVNSESLIPTPVPNQARVTPAVAVAHL